MEKKYWKGVEELRNDAEFVRLKNNEFFEEIPVDEVIGRKSESSDTTPRRDFLKFLGFGMAAATLAACEAPVKKSIPYLNKPEEIVPGIPNYYASTYFDGHDYASILVKTREGRPIKIDGNDRSSITKGVAHARVQAAVLGLYDTNRLSNARKAGAEITWDAADTQIGAAIQAAVASGKKVRVLTSTIISPATKALMAEFANKYPGTEVVTYDALSMSGTIKANEASFGKAALPTYNFENAAVIVGVDADFMGNMPHATEYARQYVVNRKLFGRREMSRHYHFESTLTVSGSNADHRFKVRPSEIGATVVSLYNKIAALAGQSAAGSAKSSAEDGVARAAKALWSNRGKSIVVCGTNDVNIQTLVNGINSMLGNYGTTIRMDMHSNLRQGDDQKMAA
ncbi:MAG: TAT-variant-translocated molybdopterin oxidoreductase, partial [Bacteroidota bacterium]